jgi:cytochrome b
MYFRPAMQQVLTIEDTAGSGAKVKVWDLPVRLFHWIMVAGFVSAYLTARYHHGELHVLIGYALCLLLAVRLFWGFYGSHYARFKSFIFSPRETAAYLRSMLTGSPRHYFGHNPAGALMVFALLTLLVLIFITGLMTLAVIDFEGPLLTLVHYVDDQTSYAIRHFHAFLINTVLLLVALHIMGVIVGSIQHKENLVRAMVTGRKRKPLLAETESN